MSGLSYKSKFALLAMVAFIGVAVSALSLELPGLRIEIFSNGAFLLNVIMVVAASAASVIAFGASLAKD